MVDGDDDDVVPGVGSRYDFSFSADQLRPSGVYNIWVGPQKLPAWPWLAGDGLVVLIFNLLSQELAERFGYKVRILRSRRKIPYLPRVIEGENFPEDDFSLPAIYIRERWDAIERGEYDES